MMSILHDDIKTCSLKLCKFSYNINSSFFISSLELPKSKSTSKEKHFKPGHIFCTQAGVHNTCCANKRRIQQIHKSEEDRKLIFSCWSKCNNQSLWDERCKIFSLLQKYLLVSFYPETKAFYSTSINVIKEGAEIFQLQSKTNTPTVTPTSSR